MSINMTNFKEQTDGSATLDLHYDKDFEVFLKEKFGWKRVTQKRIEKFINDTLLEMVSKDIKNTQ